jgi:hypothetical protein
MTEAWSVTLGWRDVLNLALAALAVIQFLKNRRVKESCSVVIQRQSTQTAAHAFAEMARTASDVETWIGKSDWDRSLELAKRMMVSLAEGVGAWSSIIESADVDLFAAARAEIRSVEVAVSLARQNEPSLEQAQEMKQKCINAAAYLAEIAGRLKRPEELKPTLKWHQRFKRDEKGSKTP